MYVNIRAVRAGILTFMTRSRLIHTHIHVMFRELNSFCAGMFFLYMKCMYVN